MIPLRVYLKNFLCHEEQEFQFEEHPVWLLHGPNGVGKSAVFDAIVYALYCVSSRSSRKEPRNNSVADVIRHGESSMRVEFDFEVSGQRYQVWRTRTRSGAKQGVNQWMTDGWSPIRDINGSQELDNWVEHILGLTYGAFVSAVLLRQGDAEKLIDADKDDRRELFRSFIELEPYIELHDTVTGARAELSTAAKQLRIRFEGMATITDDELAEAIVSEQCADQDLQNRRVVENAARDRRGHARTWELHEISLRRIQSQLDSAAERARQADELELAVGRLEALRELVPILTRVGQLQRGLVAAEERYQGHLVNQAAGTIRNAELAEALGQSQTDIGTFRDQVTKCDQQILIEEADLARLSAEIGRAEKATGLHLKLVELKAKNFDPDLDNQINHAVTEVNQSQSAKDAVTHLGALVMQRVAYRQAIANEKDTSQKVAQAVAEVERLQLAVAGALTELTTATANKSETQQAAAVAKEQLKQAKKRRDQFISTATKPICSECLQPIDAAHASKERGKLEVTVKEAEAHLTRSNEEATTATAQAEAIQNRHRDLGSGLRSAEQERDAAIRDRDDLHRRATDAQTGFDQALKALGETASQRVAAICDDGFPTADDVVDIRKVASELPVRIRSREDLHLRRTDRDQTHRDIEILDQSISAVGAPADVTAARAALTQIKTNLDELRIKHAYAKASQIAAEETERKTALQQRQCEVRLTQLAGEVARCEADVTSTYTQLNAAIEAVPDLNRATALTTSERELRILADELGQIVGDHVEEQYAALFEDRTLQADRERQLADVQAQIAQLPEDARRPSTEVEREVLAAEAATRAGERLHEIARSNLKTLSSQQLLHQETEQHLQEVEQKHSLHERLASLLGPDGIQLDLVRAEEGRIIARANDILVRLSTGELRLEPPDPESKRAFDMYVRRRGCPEPIAVSKLSGGQRFRTAVSLALSLCQGAGDAARRLESVIIDEGFGSLDRDGRTAMIAELRDGQCLAHMFKRIIVVSHQEDFAAAFPVGYRFWSENASTRTEAFGTH